MLLVLERPYADYFARKLVYEVLDVFLLFGFNDEDGMVNRCAK